MSTVPPKPAYDIQIADSINIMEECICLIYGQSGIGKTTIARMFPDPLFLMMRGGGEHRPLPLIGSSIPYVEFSDKPQLDSFILDITRSGMPKLKRPKSAASLPDAIDKMAQSGNYEEWTPKTLVIDQLTTMYNIMMNHCMTNVARKRDNVDTPAMQDYQQARRIAMRFFFDLAKVKCHKVFLCLEEIDTDETGNKRGLPSVPGKLAGEVMQYTDFVFHMVNTREAVGQPPKLQEFRALHTQPHGLWQAKDSSGKLDPMIRSTGTDFNLWEYMLKKIGG